MLKIVIARFQHCRGGGGKGVPLSSDALLIVSKIAYQRMFQLSDPGVPRTFVEDCSSLLTCPHRATSTKIWETMLLKHAKYALPVAFRVSKTLAVLKLPNVSENVFISYPSGGGVGYSQKNWVGVCGPPPKTLTLFMTKICDIPYPVYDLTKNSKPNFMTRPSHQNRVSDLHFNQFRSSDQF